MSDGGKGSARRPGTLPSGAWERTFGGNQPQREPNTSEILEELETENRMLRARNDRLEREAAEREAARCIKGQPALMQIAEPAALADGDAAVIRAALMRNPATNERVNALAALDKIEAAMLAMPAVRGLPVVEPKGQV